MFLTQGFRAGPGPTDDFWFQPAAQATLSGTSVTSTTAMAYSMIWKCVRAYADAVSCTPRRLMRQVSDSRRDRVVDHPVARILSVRPNQWQTPAQFAGMLEAHAELRGNGYGEIFHDSKYMPEAVVPIHPDRVETERMLDGSPRWKVAPPPGFQGDRRTLLPGEMLHVTLFSMDGLQGMSPIAAQREAIGAAIAARDFGSRFWNNDAKPGIWIEVPGKFKDRDAITDFRENFQTAYGGANRHRPAVMDRGMKIHELGLNMVDAEWVSARELSDKDLAGIWRVPLHKVGILADAKYANIEQQSIEWVTDCLLPRYIGWEEAIHRDLLQHDEELYVKFVPDALLRGDIKARYEAYSKGIQDGHLTRNEARLLEDRDPLPGLDEPLQPLNMRGANQQLLPDDRGRSDRAQAILQAAAERVARREAALVTRIVTGAEDAAEAFRKHAKFVAEVLALPTEVAQGYCSQVQARVEDLVATGAGATITVDDWTDTQFAALLRLGA